MRKDIALVGVLLAGALAGGAAAQAAEPVVLADGHVDYGARLIGGQLQSQVKDTTRGNDNLVWREPSDVVFHLGASARVTLPNNPRLAFLGRPGDRIWLIPQVQKPGVLWAGWNTEEIRPTDITGQVTWTLTNVEGPGVAALFSTSGIGETNILFNSSDGLPDALDVPPGTHAHGNWAFNRAGTYRLTFQMSATLPNGQTTTDTETLAVTVTGSDAPPTPPGGGSPPGGGPPGSGNPPPGASPLTLKLTSARLRERRLTLKLRLSGRSRVSVAVRKRARTVARAKARDVPAGTRRLNLRLDRRLKPGRYTVRVQARAGSRQITRTIALRVRSARRR